MTKGFDDVAFMGHLNDTFIGFSGVEGLYLRELVENLITYAHRWEHVGKDQFVNFLSSLLPDLEFGEVAIFMEDDCLTEKGKEEKEKWRAFAKKHGIQLPEIH